jgi:hypothetical protein
MQNTLNKKYLKVLVLTLLLIAPLAINVVLAQPVPPPPPVVPPGVPIDGGILLLLSGLAAYGAKKIYNK